MPTQCDLPGDGGVAAHGAVLKPSGGELGAGDGLGARAKCAGVLCLLFQNMLEIVYLKEGPKAFETLLLSLLKQTIKKLGPYHKTHNTNNMYPTKPLY